MLLQGIRRRFVAKQPASQQLAEPVAKRRRLSEKQPVPALLAFPSLPAVAVLPVDPNLWGDLSRDAFDEYSHRKQYRIIYNKFGYWWWRTEPTYVQHEQSSVTEELWKLARREFGSLSFGPASLFLLILAVGLPHCRCSMWCSMWLARCLRCVLAMSCMRVRWVHACVCSLVCTSPWPLLSPSVSATRRADLCPPCKLIRCQLRPQVLVSFDKAVAFEGPPKGGHLCIPFSAP